MTETTDRFLEAVRPLVAAVGGRLLPPEEMTTSDVPLRWDGDVVAAVRVPALSGALERMIGAVETELGGPLATLPRERKQVAVRMLDERGAFLLRKSIEDVADVMGVSRITIYNYLNATRRSR